MQRVSLLWYRSKLSRYLSPYAAALVVLAFVSGVVLLRRPSLATTVVALSTSAHPSAPPATVVKRPLHIYRLQSIDYIALEFASWVEYLEGMGRPLVWHVETDLLVEDALVMGEDPKPVVEEMAKKGFHNVGFFQYADERGFKDAYLHYSRLPYVLRTYYLPKLYKQWGSFLTFIPTGSNNLIRPSPMSSLLPASLRSIQCNFFGSISDGYNERNHARRMLVESLQKQGNPCLSGLQGVFGGDKRPFDFALMLKNSMFTIAVRGHSEETIRLYDALACGSIPIVLRKYTFLELPHFRDAPFLILDTFDDLSARLKQLVADKPALDAMQRAAVEWYRQLRVNTSAAMAARVDKSFRDAYGVDC